jgi:sugar lactone lactonase YvrE
VHRFDPSTGRHTRRDVDAPVGAVALRAAGGLLIAAGRGVAVCADGQRERIGEVDAGDRVNDGACDPLGRYLIGTLVSEDRPGQAALYQLDRGHMRRLLDGVTISNGLDWSPDGGTLYYVDTPSERVDAFDYDLASGELSHRRVFVDLADVPGRPDGLAVDADGGVWVAMARGGSAVRHFTRDGRAGYVVPVPAPNVTSLAFGGPDLDRLFVTTSRVGVDAAEHPLAGCVFSVAAPGGLCGRVQHRYLD